MKTIISAGQDLQKFINSAQPGDILALEPGSTFQGNFILPTKTQVVTITSNSSLPDRRVKPEDANLMATLVSGNADTTLNFENSKNWKVDGINFNPTNDGNGTLITCQDSENITIDRILFMPPEETGQRRCVGANGKNITLRRSHIERCWAKSLQDSQCFCAWDGAGPYLVQDNHLESASENVMFGGASCKSADRIPSDITVEDNYMTKPLDWQGKRRAVKNSFELKNAKRVTVRRNVFENVWTDAQSGFCILISVRSEAGQPYCTIEDVTFEYNTVRVCERGLNLLGTNDGDPSQQGKNWVFKNNLWQPKDWLILVGGEVNGLVFSSNTCFHGGSTAVATGGWIWPAGEPAARPSKYAAKNFEFINNLAYMNTYGFHGDDGKPFLDWVKEGLVFTNNALANRKNNQQMPGTNWYPTSAAHEANFNGFILKPDSPYQTMATDGKALGMRPAEVTPEPPEPEPPTDITFTGHDYMCNTCGTVVVDRELHAKWHSSLR